MIDAAECRDRAKDCANRARTEASLRLRSVYSSLARSWATLATQIERQINYTEINMGTEATQALTPTRREEEMRTARN
jgi:hypothetical protein